MESVFKVGSVVKSYAGRDKGNLFLVIEVVDDMYVKIIDGKLRKLNAPKLKKIKHLKLTGFTLEEIAQRVNDGKKIYDNEIYCTLQQFIKN